MLLEQQFTLILRQIAVGDFCLDRVLVPDMDTWHGQYPGGNPPTGWFPAD